MTEVVFDWRSSLTHTLEEFVNLAIGIVPQLVGAIIFLLVGWVIAHVGRMGTKKLVEGLDLLFRRTAKTDGIEQERIKHSYAMITSKAVFWIIILFFVTATGNMLGWQMFSEWMNGVIGYLPNIVTGVLIILLGILLGNGMKSVIVSTANPTSITQSAILGRSLQILIILTAVIIGVGQIGINVRLLSNILLVVIGVLLSGGALAFGLGAKTLIANIIGAQYIRKHCRIGEEVIIGDVNGVIAEVTHTSIVLDTDTVRTVIPAKMFQEQIMHFASGEKGSETA